MGTSTINSPHVLLRDKLYSDYLNVAWEEIPTRPPKGKLDLSLSESRVQIRFETV